MMRSWINKMMDDQNGYAWHPYTTGERISNAFMFGILTSKDIYYPLLAFILLIIVSIFLKKKIYK